MSTVPKTGSSIDIRVRDASDLWSGSFAASGFTEVNTAERSLKVQRITFVHPDRDEVNVRTFSTLARPKSITFWIPDRAGQAHQAVITCNTFAPVADMMLDCPWLQEQGLMLHQLSFTTIKYNFCIPVGEKTWPSWIDASQTFVENLVTAKRKHVTPSQLMVDYLGMITPVKDECIIFEEAGIRIRGSASLPWTAAPACGAFELHCLRNDAERFFFVSLRDENLLRDLAIFQDGLVDASDVRLTERGLPGRNTHAVGLIASQLPEELRWTYTDGVLTFNPERPLFDLEVRGSANATSRIGTRSLQLIRDGNHLRVLLATGDGAPAADLNDILSYEFADESGRWSGQLELDLEPESFQSLVQYTPYLQGKDHTPVWVLTESGPLRLPLENVQEKERDFSKERQKLVNGVIRLSCVPWKVIDLTILKSPAYPDITNERKGSLLLLDAQRIDAEFTFHHNPSSVPVCSRISFRMHRPDVLAEEFLPVFIPNYPFDPQSVVPPDLPSPGEASAREPFVGLSFTSRKNQSPNAAVWSLQIDYAPWAQSELSEGTWGESSLGIKLDHHLVDKAMFWYKTNKVPFIPKLPYYQNPFHNPEKRLTINRLYMPFGFLADAKISLKPGHRWQVPRVSSATLEEKSLPTQEVFQLQWTHLTMPGMIFGLRPGTTLRIEDGDILDGAFELTWSYELPLLQEVNALRSITSKEKEFEPSEEKGEAPAEGTEWWSKLATLDALASTEDSILARTQYDLNDKGIKPVVLPLSNVNLMTQTPFAGQVFLDITKSETSLTVRNTSGEEFSVINSSSQLEGPTIAFRIEKINGINTLIPTSEPGDVVLRAGCLVPYAIDADRFADAFGSQFSSLQNGGTFKRSIRVTEAGMPKEYVQWTTDRLSIRNDHFSMELYVIGLPLNVVSATEYRFRPSNELRHPLLREYSWGTIGLTILDGFQLQVFGLEEVLFARSSPSSPPVLKKVSFSGILHSRPAKVASGMYDKQRVTLNLEASGGEWWVTSVSGNIVWPLYAAQPDLSDANNKDEKIYPCIESSLAFVNGIRFGSEENPPTLVIPFMDVLWEVPLNFRGREFEHLTWSVKSSSQHAELHPTGGMIYLPLADVQPLNSSVTFALTFFLENFGGNVMEVDLNLAFRNDFTHLSLDNLKVFAKNNNQLVQTQGDDSLQVRLSAGMISFALNLAQFESKMVGELLPGWKFPARWNLSAFADAHFERREPTLKVRSLPTRMARMVIEGEVQTPDRLGFVMTWQQNSAATQLSMQLTGKLVIPSWFTWRLPGRTEDLQHEVEFYPVNQPIGHAALVPSTIPHCLFQLSDSNDGQEVSWSSIANHRFYSGSGASRKIHLQWTVPQRVKVVPASRLVKTLFDKRISFQGVASFPPIKTTAGFYGETGAMLSKYLKETRTLVYDASEAWWVRCSPVDETKAAALPAQSLLWQDRARTLKGTKGSITEINNHSGAWVRLPLPTMGDSQYVVRSAIEEGKTDLRDALFNAFSSNNEKWLTDPSRWSDVAYSTALEKLPIERNAFQGQIGSASRFYPGRPSDEWFKGFYSSTRMPSRPLTEWLHFENGDMTVFPMAPSSVPELIRNRDYKKQRDCDRDFWDDEMARDRIWGYERYVLNFESKSQAEYAFEIVEDSTCWLDLYVYNCGTFETKFKVSISPGNVYELTIPAGRKWNTLRIKDVQMIKGKHNLTLSGVKNKFTLRWIQFSVNAESFIKTKIDGYQFKAAGHLSTGSKNEKVEYILYEVDVPAKNPYNVAVVLNSVSKSGWGEIHMNGSLILRVDPGGKEIKLTKVVDLKKGLNSFELMTDSGRKLQIKSILIEPVIQIDAPPFASTVVALTRLSQAGKANCLAAAEIVPVSRPIASLDESSVSYFMASPYTSIVESEPDFGNQLKRQFQLQALQIGPSPNSVLSIEPELIGIANYVLMATPDETWTGLFTMPSSVDNLGDLERAKMIRWARKLSSKAGFIRAQSSTPVNGLSCYYMLPSNIAGNDVTKSVVEFMSASRRITVDSHFHPREVAFPAEALLAGPDFLSGMVYYQPSTENVRTSGSGVGIAVKIAAAAAGPDHASRVPLEKTVGAYHQWIEHSRETVFNDLTLQDRTEVPMAVARKLPPQTLSMAAITPPRISVIYTQGRAGAKTLLKSALLIEQSDHHVQRSASSIQTLRHPRPVPLPVELLPIPPAKPGDAKVLETCSVRPSSGVAPFFYRQIEWQDPLFNRRLLAVAQQKALADVTICLDRAIYAATDVIYPEIILSNPAKHPTITMSISLTIVRQIAGTSEVIEEVSFALPMGGESRQEQANLLGMRRWVYEIGLNQDEPLDDYLHVNIQNMDKVMFKVTVKENNQTGILELEGTIRTDKEVWPQPQSAFGVVRRGAPQEHGVLVAFGWFVKPKMVKRNDRFVETSWAGTFRYTDVFLPDDETADDSYEIRSVSSYGEQLTQPI